MPTATELLERYDRLSAGEKVEVDRLIALDIREHPWRPLIDVAHPERVTPQQRAYDSQADFLLYGGSAGGGKSDLLIGLAATAHKRSLLLRREKKQLSALIERSQAILGREYFREAPDTRHLLPNGSLIRFDGLKDPGSEKAHQGNPYDFYGFDEVTEILESQFRFVVTWNRSSNPNQRCRVVAASNPPTTAEGEWIIRFWAPWLDKTHPNPALPGELRWFISDAEGRDTEVEGPDPVVMGGELVSPRSRTFIPSSVEDNPFLMATGYKAVLQSLPEPLRSQMLRGDFTAGREDDPWQVIPTAWIIAAQDRWKPERPENARMSALGVDVAMGGKAQTVLQPRYKDWLDEPAVHPGASTPDSRISAGLVVGALRDGAPACIDVIGPGGEVYGHLDGQGVNVVSCDGSKPSTELTKESSLPFVNKRAEWYWRMREALDPAGDPIRLPPNATLRADLAAPRWKMTPRGIQVEAKPDIIKRLGRSPDFGDAAVYALIDAPSVDAKKAGRDHRSGYHGPGGWMR